VVDGGVDAVVDVGLDDVYGPEVAGCFDVVEDIDGFAVDVAGFAVLADGAGFTDDVAGFAVLDDGAGFAVDVAGFVVLDDVTGFEVVVLAVDVFKVEVVTFEEDALTFPAPLSELFTISGLSSIPSSSSSISSPSLLFASFVET